MAHLYRANFMCEYAKSDRGKCKACANYIGKNALKLGTFGDFADHWDDSRWYHYKCFWTKCFYRIQLINSDVNNPNFCGFFNLTDADKERVKKSLTKLIETIKSKQGKLKQGSTEDGGDEWEPNKKKGDDGRKMDGYRVGDHMYELGDMRFINISKFKDVVLIAIREFYKPTKAKTLKPSKTGISLTAEQYAKLLINVSGIDRALAEVTKGLEEPATKKQKTGKGKAKSACIVFETSFPLSDIRRTRVMTIDKDGEKQLVVDIREYTKSEEGGEDAPTDKGIALTIDQWTKFKAYKEAVDRELKENFAVFL